ncbi:MAG TPA: hypothetical protein VNS09_13365 [Solirubrobacter sp.]|nr:hypothetical protein [Solirubrobacter sp.]
MNITVSTCPALVFLLGPWLLAGLLLTGPFLVLLTLVVVLTAAAALVAGAAALVAAPFVLVRRRLVLQEVPA